MKGAVVPLPALEDRSGKPGKGVREMKNIVCLAGLALCAATAMGQIDGVKEANYGTALAVQSVQTGFGNAGGGNAQTANGSELDAAYCRTDGGNLNLMLTGNLESNFNKLEIFFDFRSGGQNTLDGSIPGAGQLNGLTFDNGFNADLWISVTCGGGPFGVYVNAWEIGVGSPSDYLGSNNGGGALGGGNNWLNLGLGLNNSNGAGVAGGNAAANAAAALAVTTGVELSIPLAYFGGSVNGVKVSAMINGSNHDYLSNQILGGLAGGTGNLGGDGAGGFTGNLAGVNFNQFAGDQFFVLPSPGAAALLGLGGIVAMRRRRA